MADDDNFDSPENPDDLNGGANDGSNDGSEQNGSDSGFDSEDQPRPASDRPLKPRINSNGQLVLPDGSKLVQMPIEDELKGSYLTYAMSVIVSRAIPDVRDGLKPSQRRILVAMNDLGIGPHAQRVKCAKISGDASGNYHPHGEAIIYPTLVRMAQEWNMRHVLVDKQGNFGSIAGLPPAAMRYTEARLSGMAMAMLEDLNLDTVDFVPTYDETRMEPTVLPSKVPNLIVNGANGIAVGMMTSIPPHNLGEVCDAAVAMIDDPNISPWELLRLCPGPDFPTGGIICGTSGIRKSYLTGRGNIVVRARTRVETKDKRCRIIVSEIPYQQARDRIEEKIAEMVKEGRVEGVATIRNESDLKEPVRLVLELKKEADPNVVLNQLYQFTPLQDTFSIILLALVNGKPQVLTFKQLLEEFLRHRQSVIRRRTTFLLNKSIKRQHTVEGLLIAHANIDEVIRTIRTSPNQFEAKQRLMQIQCPAALLERCLGKGFESVQASRGVKEFYTLTPVQADAILKMTLGQLVNLEQQKLADEYNALINDISEYRRILSDERNILAIVRQDMIDVKEKYADKRRTAISQNEIIDVDDEDLITEETMVVTISNDGYVKRTALSEYKAQRRGGQGVKGAKLDSSSSIRDMYVASTHDYMLFFTNKGRVYWQKVYSLPMGSRDSKGRSMTNVLALSEDETVANCLPVRDFDQEDAYLFMATREGVVKKTKLSEFKRPVKNGKIAIRLRGGEPETTDDDGNPIPVEEQTPSAKSNDKDALVAVAVCVKGDEIFLSTANGRTIRFRESDVRAMGRTASGVRGIRLRSGDQVVGMVIAEEESYILSVCENGYGKRTPMGPNAPAVADADADELAEQDENEDSAEDASIDEGTDGDSAASNVRYRTMHRGGQGVLDIKTTARNGRVVAVLRVKDGDEIMLISKGGKIQRISVDDVRATGRNTQGVRLMSLKNDVLAAANAVPPEREVDEAKEIVGVDKDFDDAEEELEDQVDELEEENEEENDEDEE